MLKIFFSLIPAIISSIGMFICMFGLIRSTFIFRVRRKACDKWFDYSQKHRQLVFDISIGLLHEILKGNHNLCSSFREYIEEDDTDFHNEFTKLGTYEEMMWKRPFKWSYKSLTKDYDEKLDLKYQLSIFKITNFLLVNNIDPKTFGLLKD